MVKTSYQSMQKCFNEKKFYNKRNGFHRIIKLKARSHKIRVLHKNDHTTEATDNEIDKKNSTYKTTKML